MMLPRRTPLKRTKRLKRTAFKRRAPKRHRLSDTKADIQAWRDQHESCACCWKHYRTFGVILDAHHIWNAARRAAMDCIYNLLVLCRDCHKRLGEGRDNRSICLYLKRESDSENYDPERMQETLRRFGTETLPELPAALPAWILEARAA